MDSPIHESNIDSLVSLFKSFNSISSNIQAEMSCALMSNDANKLDVVKQLKKSESEVQERIDRAVYAFVGVMPLASMNNINLFMEAILLHVQLTGNPVLNSVVERVNQITFDTEF